MLVNLSPHPCEVLQILQTCFFHNFQTNRDRERVVVDVLYGPKVPPTECILGQHKINFLAGEIFGVGNLKVNAWIQKCKSDDEV